MRERSGARRAGRGGDIERESARCDIAGRACSIVVTQPRRLAAMALADRVASELGEAAAGGLCGYRIRGEACVSSRTALTFVTTGVLLRQLEDDPTLASISHLIVDEARRSVRAPFAHA